MTTETVTDGLAELVAGGMTGSSLAAHSPAGGAARMLGRRLATCVPLAAVTIALAVVPAVQFPGWQWASLVLAGLAVAWGAWPLHRAAWQGLGHAAATADTLVSLGLIASIGWSVYALLFGGAGALGLRMPFTVALGTGSASSLYLATASGVTVMALAARYLEARADSSAGERPAARARTGRLADQVARVFVPCVISLAAATAGFWLGAGLPAAAAWSNAVAVLVVACPCALSLATPTALLAALRRGAELGILVTNVQVLESAGLLRAVVLDEAGTLTARLATGNGTGAVSGTADLTVVSGDRASISDAIQLARATQSVIRLNITWALAYNVAAIPLASLGYLKPQLAGIALAVSSLIVVANSLLLRRFRPRKVAVPPTPGPDGRCRPDDDGASPMTTAAAAPRAVLRGLAMAALAPLGCAVVLIVLLASWVIGGGGGTIARVRIEVSSAAVSMAPATRGQAVTYLTLVNLGGPDQLLSVTSPAARGIELVQHAGSAAGPGRVLQSLPIPARATVSLSPFGSDIVLMKPGRLTFGETLPLVLTFRHAGHLTVEATVTAPGTP